VVELTQGHVGTDVFAHCNEHDADDSESLESVVLLLWRLLLLSSSGVLILILFFLLVILFLLLFVRFRLLEMLIAVVQHSLHLENIAGAGERADVDEDLSLLRYRVLDDLECLDRSI
jgi:hypothetical protein